MFCFEGDVELITREGGKEKPSAWFTDTPTGRLSPRAPFLTYYLQSTELITTHGFYIASIVDKEAKLPLKS